MKLVLFTRYPVPGAAKTRLIPALGAQGAADLHRRLTGRTLATLLATGLPVEVRCTGAAAPDFRAWLGDAPAYAPQGDGDLGARLARAAAAAPVVLIGADVPDLAPAHILAIVAALADHPVAIGPAEDGGYWALGLAAPLQPRLFENMIWGTATVFAQTVARLAAAGVTPFIGPTLADLDRPEDLARWPGL